MASGDTVGIDTAGTPQSAGIFALTLLADLVGMTVGIHNASHLLRHNADVVLALLVPRALGVVIALLFLATNLVIVWVSIII